MDNETHDYIDWVLMSAKHRAIVQELVRVSARTLAEFESNHIRGEVIERKGNVTTVQFK